MKKTNMILLVIAVICICMIALTACGTTSSESAAAPASTQETAASSYEDIYEEYAQKIKAATPSLIEEYKAEAANNTAGMNGLAELSNGKIEKLAAISVEGTEKMAALMLSSGSGNSSEYDDWAAKLNSVYMEEAQKITDEYMASVIG